MTPPSVSPEPDEFGLSTAPDWVAAEMPPGYHTRLAEIERLSADLRALDPFGRLLWAAGRPLAEAVRDAFRALNFDAEFAPESAGSGIAVNVDFGRLLVHVAPKVGVVRKKDASLAHVFQMLHELAEANDRVVLVANNDPATPPLNRAEGIEPDAIALLKRIGANFLASPSLFRLWILSLHDVERGRTYVQRLHEQDGGIFIPPI